MIKVLCLAGDGIGTKVIEEKPKTRVTFFGVALEYSTQESKLMVAIKNNNIDTVRELFKSKTEDILRDLTKMLVGLYDRNDYLDKQNDNQFNPIFKAKLKDINNHIHFVI